MTAVFYFGEDTDGLASNRKTIGFCCPKDICANKQETNLTRVVSHLLSLTAGSQTFKAHMDS